MPRRDDIHKVLIIGSGPIVIGQACEFDYSGTQAMKALKKQGYETILVNSNPATIMTDPELSDRTYVEPLTVKTVEKIIQKEKPDALLPTMGGQTALNITVELAKSGFLKKQKVELIGAQLEAIQKAEDRELFKDAMVKIGLEIEHGRTNIVMGREADDRTQTIAIVPYPEEMVQLRFLIDGPEITGLYRKPGTEAWKEVGKTSLPPDPSTPPQVSLQFYQGEPDSNRWATVRDFKMQGR